jgi:hypothetical protein
MPVSISGSNGSFAALRPRALLGLAACALLVACGGSPAPSGGAAPDAASRTAALAERERAVAEREAAIAAREQEVNAKAAAAAEAAAKAESDKAAADAAAEQQRLAAEQQRLAAERAAAEAKAQRERTARATTEKRREPSVAKAAPAQPIEVSAGTRLAIALKQSLSSKTASVGQPFEAVLTSDVVGKDGRVAVPAGATLTGSITHVVSGSRNIGATPLIGLRFDHILTARGDRIAISGEIDERGASERGRDSAKILGGAAAGAVLGNQSRHNDRGKVIGALVGGALGAMAAKNTGTEVSLADGAPLTITVDQSFKVPAGSQRGG